MPKSIMSNKIRIKITRYFISLRYVFKVVAIQEDDRIFSYKSNNNNNTISVVKWLTPRIPLLCTNKKEYDTLCISN